MCFIIRSLNEVNQAIISLVVLDQETLETHYLEKASTVMLTPPYYYKRSSSINHFVCKFISLSVCLSATLFFIVLGTVWRHLTPPQSTKWTGQIF